MSVIDEKHIPRSTSDQEAITTLAKEKGLDQVVVAEAEEVIGAEHEYTEAEYKKLVRKFDWILLPIMMLTYGLQYSDKVSLSSGVVFGLKTDTHLTAKGYSLLTVWFYLAYLVGQIPMGMLLQRLPLGRGLGGTIILWGICVIGLGACNTYAQLSVVRVMLGWLECSVTPAFLLIVSSWYKREEATLRSCFFFAMNSALGGVFGIIIYALAKHSQDHGGVAGWRVINYFLGAMTVLAGFLVFFFVGNPKEVFWLNAEQKKMAHARIVGNASGTGDKQSYNWSQVKECFVDPQFYFMIGYNFLATIPNGCLGTFSTLIYSSFGFTALESVLYALPSNFISFAICIATAFVVTKFSKLRFPIAITYLIVEMIIFLFIGLRSDAPKWHRWGAFLFSGLFAITTFLLWPLMTLNTGGRTKKTFMQAMGLISYCTGNMVGSQTMKDAPKYIKGLTANAIVIAINVILIFGWWAYYVMENKRREKAFIESGMSMEEREHLNKLAGETDMTDRQNPHFRYVC